MSDDNRVEHETEEIEISAFTKGRAAFDATAADGSDVNATIVLIAHPEGQRLGSRFTLAPGGTLEIGRSAAVGISLPEVLSISRKHARLRYAGPVVTIEDLGSTNGTYVNGKPVLGRQVLKTDDRFQTAAVHFKILIPDESL